MYLSVDKHNFIRLVSETPIRSKDTTIIQTDEVDHSVLGNKIAFDKKPDLSNLKLAIICNWGDQCGIATYTKLLVDSIRPKVKEVRIFAEHVDGAEEEEGVVRCWRRGESMASAIEQIKYWKPDIVHIQHEYGIFPKATHMLKMLEMLDDIPYVLTAHAVYQHLDKTVCTAYVKNMIVHSDEANEVLNDLGHRNKVYMIHHGCVEYPDSSELWNIFHNDHTVIQFGFGFGYKGVDQAIEAVKHIVDTKSHLKDVFYCYLCSENTHTKATHQEYLNYLKDKIEAEKLNENIVILRGFQSEEILGNFLRTAKLAIFPYKTDENNIVYGASGAVRNAMANGIPVIASDSHLFDDLDGIVPRVHNAKDLADEISKVFENDDYRMSLKAKNLQYVKDNNWEMTADKHISVYDDVLSQFETGIVRLNRYQVVD